MILVDTSVWIEFFRGREPYFSKLSGLLESMDVVAHEVVFGELLHGCRYDREVEFILAYWQSLNGIQSHGVFIEAGRLSFRNTHRQKENGIIDSLLISADMDFG